MSFDREFERAAETFGTELFGAIADILHKDLFPKNIYFITYDLTDGVYHWSEVMKLLKRHGVTVWAPARAGSRNDSVSVHGKDYPKAMLILLYYGCPITNSDRFMYKRILREYFRTGRVPKLRKR